MAPVNNDKEYGTSGEITLKDVILKLAELRRYLRSKWQLITLAILIGAGMGIAYSAVKKPTYEAELSFVLDDEKSASGGLGAAAGLASQFGVDIGGGGVGGAFTGDNLLELMKSRSMVQKTLLFPVTIGNKQQTLADFYIDFSKIRQRSEFKNIEYPTNADQSKFSLLQDSLLGVLYKTIIKANLSVDKVDKKLSIITVKVVSKNELFSKYFAEVLVKNVSDFYIETRTKKSSRNVNVLQRQTDSVRRELNAAISGVASSSDISPNPNPSLQILRVPSQRKQVDVQANTAILTELVKNLELSRMSLRKETPLIQIIDNPILPLDKQQVGKAAGAIVGGFVCGFIMTLFLLLRKILKDSLL
jgi:hypothetical protein